MDESVEGEGRLSPSGGSGVQGFEQGFSAIGNAFGQAWYGLEKWEKMKQDQTKVSDLIDRRARRQNFKERYEHFFGLLVIGTFCLMLLFMFGVACTLVFFAAF